MGLKLPVLERCCFCCRVRVGALVIGYWSMFGSLMSLTGTATTIAVTTKFVQTESSKPNSQYRPEELKMAAIGVYVTCGIYIALYLYYFVISLLVVIGVHRNKPRLLTYYVNTVLFMLILCAALVVVTVVFLGVIAALPLLFSAVIVFYCLLVVRSAYLEMEDQNRPKVYELQTMQHAQQAPLMA